MEYNWNIKNINEVFAEFPQFEGKVEKMYFNNFVDKFKREELIELIDDAKFYGDKLTPQKRKELREVAEARAVYRFCFGWSQALDAVFKQRLPGIAAKTLIERMLRKRKDPFAKDCYAVGEFLEKTLGRRYSYGKYTDEEAMRDINDYD